MQLLLPIAYSFVFIILISKMRFFALESISRTKLIMLFLLKLIAGIIVWLIYTRYYAFADFQTYFSDSRTLIGQLFGSENAGKQMVNWNTEFEPLLFNNSRTMIVLNALLHIFSFGNFFVHIVFFCFFSFVGLTAFYKAFIRFYPAKSLQLIISVFLVPTVLFWSSAVSKESVIISVTGLIIYLSNFGLKQGYTIRERIVLPILIIFLVVVKIYVAIALVPLLLANRIIAKTSRQRAFLKYAFVFALTCFLGFLVKCINPDYNVLKIIADKQAKAISEARGGVFLVNDKNFICVAYDKRSEMLLPLADNKYKIKNGAAYLSWKLNNMVDTTFVINAKDTATYLLYYTQLPAHTFIKLEKIKPTPAAFIKHAPDAVLNTLFQPTLFNISSWLHLLVAVENMWLIVVLMAAIIFFDKTIIRNKEVILFSLLFAFIMFALIGITTPVIGSMVRYRTIGLLFFIPVVLMCIDEKKIKQRLFKSRMR